MQLLRPLCWLNKNAPKERQPRNLSLKAHVTDIAPGYMQLFQTFFFGWIKIINLLFLWNYISFQVLFWNAKMLTYEVLNINIFESAFTYTGYQVICFIWKLSTVIYGTNFKVISFILMFTCNCDINVLKGYYHMVINLLKSKVVFDVHIMCKFRLHFDCFCCCVLIAVL